MTNPSYSQSDDPTPLSWEQLTLLGVTLASIRCSVTVDGPGGTCAAMVEVVDLATDETVALEGRPGYRFPQDLHVALVWLEARFIYYSKLISPF